jgi:adenine deaminase
LTTKDIEEYVTKNNLKLNKIHNYQDIFTFMMYPRGRSPEELTLQIGAAMGDIAPDLLLIGGEIVNVVTGEIYFADLAIKDNRIVRVGDTGDITVKFKNIRTINCKNSYLLPGLIDSHLHTESTFLPPTHFTKVALPRGTTTAVVDPHEIVNVLGLQGLKLYVNETLNLPLEFLVEIPSCVPAAPPLENGGSNLPSQLYEDLIANENHFALAEMMNFPGVIYRDKEVMEKLSYAEQSGKIREGHAPGLVGKEMQAYLTAGISSCHESITVDEVIEKLRAGCKIQLREGSFAQNLLELGSGIKEKLADAKNPWNNVIICSDDRHADDLINFGHLDHSLRLLVNDLNLDPITSIQLCTINPANHLLRQDLGVLGPGKTANITRVNNLKDFEVLDVISKGKHAAHNNELIIDLALPSYPEWALNTLNPAFVPEQSMYKIQGPINEGKVQAHVIGVIEHSLITDHLIEHVTIEENQVILEKRQDLSYFFLIDRYGQSTQMSKSLTKGFDFAGKVAVASTVAHDSHQLLVTGNDATCMDIAVKTIIKNNGGQAIVTSKNGDTINKSLALPYAGLMSIDPPMQVARRMMELKSLSKEVVHGISEPFMALSFMALPVIPKLKLTDMGLVDVEKFELIDLFSN